jgi:hypothetical protein
MNVIAFRDELATLPEPVRIFLDKAWSPPNPDDQRIPLHIFITINETNSAVANFLNQNKPKPVLEFSLHHHSFTESFIWPNRTAEIAYALAETWNRRRPIAYCSNCGALITTKRRTTRTCSNNCRFKRHKARKINRAA